MKEEEVESFSRWPRIYLSSTLHTNKAEVIVHRARTMLFEVSLRKSIPEPSFVRCPIDFFR